MKINLTSVSHSIDLADDLIHALDGQEMADRDAVRTRKTEEAQASRDLLRLADLLAAAAASAREQYWLAKGYDSPGKETA